MLLEREVSERVAAVGSTVWTRARFRCKIFCKMGIVTFSLLFDKYCPIMV
jgi:hypothetical protein